MADVAQRVRDFLIKSQRIRKANNTLLRSPAQVQNLANFHQRVMQSVAPPPIQNILAVAVRVRVGRLHDISAQGNRLAVKLQARGRGGVAAY